MAVTVFRSNENDMEKYSETLKYWSNACGDLHFHGKYDITEEQLPPELKRAYDELWSESYGSLCYLVETPLGYGVALINEYDDVTASYMKSTSDRLFDCVLADAEKVKNAAGFEKTQVFAAELSGFNDCHELVVVFPADTPVSEFERAAKELEQIAYSSVPEKESALPSLSDVISAADNDKHSKNIYLSINSERVWSATVSETLPDSFSAFFVKEKQYPVDLYYWRTDINGSNVTERATCKNRDDLISSLNWLGACGFTPIEVWGFDISKASNERLLRIFDAGTKRRFELITKEIDPFASDIEEPVTNNGFNSIGFMEYLEKTFNGFENCFLRSLVQNIIDYGLCHNHASLDQFCYWLSDMLPEVEFKEVAAYMNDSHLTAFGKEEKAKALNERERDDDACHRSYNYERDI